VEYRRKVRPVSPFLSLFSFQWFLGKNLRDPGPSLAGEHIPLVCGAGESKENDGERTRRYFMESASASKNYVDYWNRVAPVAGVDGNRTLFHVLPED
jgi:hypothetical protein